MKEMRKKKDKLMILLPMILLLISCSTINNFNFYDVKSSNRTSSKATGYEIQSHTYTNNNIEISYPKLMGLADPEREAEINRIIEKDAISIIDLDSDPSKKTDIEMDYRITFKNDKLVSIQYLGSIYTKGATYPLNIIYTTNIDLVKAIKVKLSDLVEISEIFVEKFKQGDYKPFNVHLSLQEEGVLDNALTSYSDQALLDSFMQADVVWGEKGYGTFSYITNDSIGISISVQHAIGDHIEIEIPFEKLGSELRNEYIVSKVNKVYSEI